MATTTRGYVAPPPDDSTLLTPYQLTTLLTTLRLHPISAYFRRFSGRNMVILVISQLTINKSNQKQANWSRFQPFRRTKVGMTTLPTSNHLRDRRSHRARPT